MSTTFQYLTRRLKRETFLCAKRAAQAAQRLASSPLEKSVAFVAGIQRSGTNLMMSALERSFDTEVFHESDGRAFQDFEMHPAHVIQRLVETSNAKVIVIKALCELQDLKTLLDQFSPAKAIWMVRDYDDMVNSHLAIWSGCPSTIARIIQDRNSAGWRGRGMSEHTHALVSTLYHPDMNDATAVALFWYFRNILFFEQGFDRDDRVFPVRYERVVSDPHRELGQVFKLVGIDYSRYNATKIFASSIRKAPPPPIEPRIRALCDALLARFEQLLTTE